MVWWILLLVVLFGTDLCDALAGGFGKQQGSARQTTSNKKKPGQRRSKLQEVPPQQDAVVVDKWGLPPPTVEDIFPPLHPSTELIPVDPNRDYSLSEIQTALQHYLALNLSRFGADGVEIDPPPGCAPMRLRLLHQSPPVIAIDHFLTPAECETLLQVPQQPNTSVQVDSKTFTGALSTRTSTSWFCYYSAVPVLLAKATLLGIDMDHCEEPQLVRYQPGQEFSWHYDQVPAAQLANGGQRLATLLVYLNSVARGGGTVFRDLSDGSGQALTVQPHQGTALLFFPSHADGRPDDRTLHKGEVAEEKKSIVQMWVHEDRYTAAVPEGNRQEDARAAVRAVQQELGYQ